MRASPSISSSSVEVEEAYERVLADTSVRSNFIEVGAGASDPSPGEGRRAATGAAPRHDGLRRVLRAPVERTRRGPRPGPRSARTRTERPDRPPARSVPRRSGRMAGPAPRHARRGRPGAARPLGRRDLGVVVRTRSPRPGPAARADRTPRLAGNPLPAADPADGHTGSRGADVTAGATESEVNAPIRQVHGRTADPCPSPRSDRPLRRHRPQPHRRSGRQGRATRPGVTLRLVVAFRVPTSRPCPPRRAAPTEDADARHLGHPRTARQGRGRPGRDGHDPRRTTPACCPPGTPHGSGSQRRPPPTITDFVQ